MSIFRSGLTNAVFVKCIENIEQDGIKLEVGEKYELVLDLGSMYVLKVAGGQEAVVPKTSFVVSEENES